MWSVHNWRLLADEDDFVSKVATKDTIREGQNTRASFLDSEKCVPVPSGWGGEGVGLVDKVELGGRLLELEFPPQTKFAHVQGLRGS